MDRIGFHSRLFPVQFEEEKVQVPEQAAPVTSSSDNDAVPVGRIGFRRPGADPGKAEAEVVPAEFAAECAADGE